MDIIHTCWVRILYTYAGYGYYTGMDIIHTCWVWILYTYAGYGYYTHMLGILELTHDTAIHGILICLYQGN